MNEGSTKLNGKEQRLLKYLLCLIEKRIYLLRISLCNENERYFPERETIMQKVIKKEKDFFKGTSSLSADEYKLMSDSCEIETYIRRILHEIENSHTYKSLKDIISELENESISFKKHKKMIEIKKKQVEQLKESLSQDQSLVNIQSPIKKTQDLQKITGDTVEPFSEAAFLKKLMDHKVHSRKKYYDYKTTELEDEIERFQREARIQVHANAQIISFWLLKYDASSENLDNMLKEVFDNWAEKRREYAILKKFRKLNLERIQKLHKLISERDEYIEKYRIKEEKEQKKREEELRKEEAATKIQAYWRGTMVRKHLGPYKIKKAKKKGEKSKGKKSMGKKKK